MIVLFLGVEGWLMECVGMGGGSGDLDVMGLRWSGIVFLFLND